jgi:RNA polymerase sigma-70 factor, ECF subfamily
MLQGGSAISTPDVQDDDDIRSSLSGDGDAYARLVGRYQQGVSARMWRITRTGADHAELVQEVFVEAFVSLRTYRGEAPFGHWLSRIATHVAYRFLKRQAKERQRSDLPVEELTDVIATEEDSVAPRRAAEALHRLLEQLPPRDRLVLTLRYLEERSIEETAELTGWSCTMVKVQAWRARGKLKRLFEHAGIEVNP